MTDPSRDDHPSRDARFRAKKGHIWRGVGVSAEARPVDPPMAGCREAEGFPDAGRCGRKNRQEHDLDVARQHARTEPGCMIRTEMWSFSCIQVLFIGVSQAHRAVDQRLRTCERRDSALAPLRQLPSRRAEPTRRTPVGYSSISLRSPLHSVWNVPSRSTRLYVWAPKKSRWPWMRFAGSSAARTPS